MDAVYNEPVSSRFGFVGWEGGDESSFGGEGVLVHGCGFEPCWCGSPCDVGAQASGDGVEVEEVDGVGEAVVI